MKKALVLLAFVAVTGSLLVGGSANAWSTYCSSGRVCLFDYNDYVGPLGWRNAGNPLENISAGNNDKMASWENHTSTNAAWYRDANGSGPCHNMMAGTRFAAEPLLDRDTASSWKTTRGC